MAHQRHLSRAPIREAVLDIRIPLQESLNLGRLHGTMASSGGFPETQDLKRGSMTIQLSGRGEPAPHVASEVVGVRGISDDGRWILQYRQDGMTLSRLAPYTNWKDLSQRGRALAERFLRVTEPPHVERLALRYINHFRLPEGDPAVYFVALPSFPESLPLRAESFLSKITARHKEGDLSVHVTHALLQELAPGGAGFLLDIDAFVATRFGPSTNRFWDTFERLRTLKNNVFFELITERNAEIHE